MASRHFHARGFQCGRNIVCTSAPDLKEARGIEGPVNPMPEVRRRQGWRQAWAQEVPHARRGEPGGQTETQRRDMKPIAWSDGPNNRRLAKTGIASVEEGIDHAPILSASGPTWLAAGWSPRSHSWWCRSTLTACRCVSGRRSRRVRQVSSLPALADRSARKRWPPSACSRPPRDSLPGGRRARVPAGSRPSDP
jgi:hypothetical protein